MTSGRVRFCLPLVLAAMLAGGCGREDEIPVARPPRPVTAVRLHRLDPTQYLRRTGSVASWKQEKVAFEVGGRVEWIVEEGTEVKGRALDETGKLVYGGDVLARIDKSRYALQVNAAQAQLACAKARAEAVRIEGEKVLPQQLKAAQAELTRAEKEFERVKALEKKGASTSTERETAEATYKTARARVEQIQASLDAKRAELAALEANVLQAAEALKQAQKDLEDCELRAPFTARVAKVHVIPGAYVEAGVPVVTLIVMDPIRIDLSVSAETDRAVSYGDIVTVYPPGVEEPILGWVNTKDTIADPATRTFRLTILVRNRKIFIDAPKDSALLKLSHISDLTSLEREDPAASSGPLFVDTTALRKDAKGFYVWRVEDFSFARTRGPFDPVLRVRKVRVTPGKRRINVLNYVYRELLNRDGLGTLDALVPDPPEGLRDGDRVLLVRKRWMLRPGDLVPVLLQPPASQPGFFVPMEAVIPEGGKHYVFIARGADKAHARAQKTEVRLTGSFGELRRIEGPGINESALIVLEGVHYLIPDERISVVQIKDKVEVETGRRRKENHR